jgi:hypothetical protein
MLAALLVGSLLGCTPVERPSALPRGEAGTRAWREARRELAAMRSRLAPSRPYRMKVTLELAHRELPTGAVAVRPPNALRMMLLGPGGTTALDLWVCGDRFRFAIPALDLVRRGDRTTPAEELRGLPVSFLRWWFLDPLGGRALSFVDSKEGRRFVIGDGERVTHVSRRARGLEIRRVTVGDEESLATDSRECGRVEYRQKSTGIELAVTCEAIEDAAPARAFADPDDPSVECAAP